MGKEPQDEALKPSLSKRILNLHNFNLLLGILGAVGVAFSVWAYFAAQEKHDLTYSISPTRTAILLKDKMEGLSVTYRGMSISNDVSSAEIRIWNQGRKSIRGGDISNGGDVEKPLSIHTPNGEPIYQIMVGTKTNRDETGFNISTKDTHTLGNIVFDWKILEYGDMAKIQIIYGGSVTLPILVDGTVEGQKALTRYEGNTPSTFRRIIGAVCTLIILALFLLLYSNLDKLAKRYCKTKTSIIFFIIGVCVIIASGVWGMNLLNTYILKPTQLPFWF